MFQYTMHFLMNHPELRDDICETLKARQHDPEESVRYEVVMAIVTTARNDVQVVAESEELLNFVKEQTLTKLSNSSNSVTTCTSFWAVVTIAMTDS